MTWISVLIANASFPVALQWIGWLATICSAAAAVVAAVRATGARAAAREAKTVAVKMGHVIHVSDVDAEMHELQMMILAESVNFEIVAAKCDRLRGRVARFKTEAVQYLPAHAKEDLDLCREQLVIMTRVANNLRRREDTRWRDVQNAFGDASEALNRVTGTLQNEIRGDEA